MVVRWIQKVHHCCIPSLRTLTFWLFVVVFITDTFNCDLAQLCNYRENSSVLQLYCPWQTQNATRGMADGGAKPDQSCNMADTYLVEFRGQWWNELPTNVRTAESLAIFCNRLKTCSDLTSTPHSMNLNFDISLTILGNQFLEITWTILVASFSFVISFYCVSILNYNKRDFISLS